MVEKKPSKDKRPILNLGEKKTEKKNSYNQGGKGSGGSRTEEPNVIKIIRSAFFRTLIYGSIVILISVWFSKNQTKPTIDSKQIVQGKVAEIKEELEASYPDLKFEIISTSKSIKIDFLKLDVDQSLVLKNRFTDKGIETQINKNNLTLNLNDEFFSNYKIPGRTGMNWSLFSLLVTCLLMALYHLKCKKYINTVTSKEVFADSFYYLGFLFTFITLLFVVSIGNIDGSISLIRNMGVALATTVVGLAYRIYLTQFNPITNEPVENTQKEMGMLASNLVDISSNLQNTLTKVTKDIGLIGNLLNQQINTVDLNKFNKTLDPFKNNLNSLNLELDKIRNDTSRITSEINNSAQSLNSITGSLDRIKNVADSSEEVIEEIKSTNAKINDNQVISNDNLEQINNKIQSVAQSLEKNKAMLENSSFQVEASTKQFTEASGKMVEDTLKIRTSMKEKLLDLFNFLKK